MPIPDRGYDCGQLGLHNEMFCSPDNGKLQETPNIGNRQGQRGLVATVTLGRHPRRDAARVAADWRGRQPVALLS
jgi:hypothetical protein